MNWPAVMVLSMLAAACASAPLEQAGSLRSWDNNLKPSDGLLTRSRIAVSRDDVLAAKTIRIKPTTFQMPGERAPFNAAQRSLVTNAVDRTLCAGLSARFEVVGPSEPADLIVHAVITHATPTDPVAVGLSKGASVAKTVLLPGVPVPVPRIPIGLGSLSLEAEARDPLGDQKAAMIWGRGASVLVNWGGSRRKAMRTTWQALRRRLQQIAGHRSDTLRNAAILSIRRDAARSLRARAEISSLRGVRNIVRPRRVDRRSIGPPPIGPTKRRRARPD